MTFSIVIPAFNEELLKKWECKCGLKFIILTRHPLVTSPRSRIKLYTRQEIAGQLFSVLFCSVHAKRCWTRKKLPIWYDGRR